jgi:hypothetical protein
MVEGGIGEGIGGRWIRGRNMILGRGMVEGG